MSVQFIKLDNGSELAVLPREEYERLVSLDQEDVSAARLVSRARDDIAHGREVAVPIGVADAIAGGENRIKALRIWRGLTPEELALQACLTLGYLSDLENGEPIGPAATLSNLSHALKVPRDFLIA